MKPMTQRWILSFSLSTQNSRLPSRVRQVLCCMPSLTTCHKPSSVAFIWKIKCAITAQSDCCARENAALCWHVAHQTQITIMCKKKKMLTVTGMIELSLIQLDQNKIPYYVIDHTNFTLQYILLTVTAFHIYYGSKSFVI